MDYIKYEKYKDHRVKHKYFEVKFEVLLLENNILKLQI